ncbi:MAG: cell division protein FtsA [Anaerolineae bacterium]
MDRTIVGIDVGTTKICTLVGEVDPEGGLRIVGVGVTPSRGIRKGVVVDVKECTSAIAESMQKAERVSGYQIVSAYVGLAGAHVDGINNRGVVAINQSSRRGVQAHDVDRALEAAQAIALPHNRQVLHVIPRGFTIDGDDGVRDPIGMQAYRLEVEAHIVTGATSSIHNLVKCVQANGIEIDALVLEPLASGEAVLTSTEREMGVVLADIGGGTTDIAIFIEGSIWHSVVLPTGGEQLTNDIAIGLQTPFDAAEEIKIKYGQARPQSVAPDEEIDILSFGEGGRQRISRQFLAQIIQARMEETLELILREIKRSGYDGLLPAGVVLTGGTAELAALRGLARDVLGLPVRIGAPQDLRGLVDTLNSPAFSTSVGLLEWGLTHDAPRAVPERRNGQGKLWNWLKVFLPE